MVIFSSIGEEEIPRIYGFGFSSKPQPTLTLSINDDLIYGDRISLRNFYFTESAPPDIGLFEYAWKKKIGFGGALSFEKQTNGFSVYKIKIPKIKDRGRQRIEEISASLSVVLDWMNYHLSRGKRMDCGSMQLLELQTVCFRKIHGGSLYSTFSPTLCGCLEKIEIREQAPSLIHKTEEAMEATYKQMLQRRASQLFEARIGKGKVFLTCPGDTCGLDFRERTKKGGCRLFPHNVDSSIQQLVLIAGLAVIHDTADKALQW